MSATLSKPQALMLAAAMSIGVIAPVMAQSAPTYQAKITRTTMGVPHIKADTYASLGYGVGYSFGEDNVCTMMEDIISIRGERSLHFGPDGRYNIPSVPASASNVDSDFFWKLMATPTAIARMRNGMQPEVRNLVTGYVAGFNRYVAELKSGQHPGRHAACATASYLRPLVEDDIYARFYRLAILASSSVFMTEIATAQPPALSLSNLFNTLDPILAADALKRDPGPLAFFSPEKPMGSNAYALGAQATQDGSSMLLGNPHFPFSGAERLWMMHLTIPGQLDVQGAGLYGSPLPQIGFTPRISWTHTVSTGYRFSIYQLAVNPLQPTQYWYDGELREMTAVPLSIKVKTSSGIETRTRTLYRTHYGPVLTLTSGGIPVLGWDNTRVYTIRDANETNNRLINQFLAFARANSLAEFIQAHKSILGIPWVNTIATGPGEAAYYGDVSVIPNVPDELVTACSAPVVSTLVGTAAPGLPVLLGSTSACGWKSDPDAPVPGIFGPGNLPTLVRNDSVSNMNNSYWLTNPAQPITGYDRIIGDENAERTLRTRLGLLQIQRRLDGSDGRAGMGFTFDQLKDITLAANVQSADLALDDVLSQTCFTVGARDISRACSALAGWDRTGNLSSTGAHVWREFWLAAAKANLVWATPFSPLDPVNTPRNLATLNPQIRIALEDAQASIEARGIALDAPLGNIQFSGAHPGLNIPILGLPGPIGAFTNADSWPMTDGGYTINYGNSYIQAVNWTGAGLRAEGFLTYGQSADPASPNYRDFMDRYRQKQWLRFAFTDDEILASRVSSKVITN